MEYVSSGELDKNTFGTRLKQLLSENRMSLADAAEIVHLSTSTISRYVNGSMSPKVTTVEKLAEYFSVSPSWLMGIPGSETLNESKKVKTELLLTFNSLNPDGQTEALKQVKLISLIPRYTN